MTKAEKTKTLTILMKRFTRMAEWSVHSIKYNDALMAIKVCMWLVNMAVTINHLVTQPTDEMKQQN